MNRAWKCERQRRAKSCFLIWNSPDTMASPAKSLPANVAGSWFVDSTCIDCDTCRQLAPRVFGEADGYSFVREQPQTKQDEAAALHALVSCPTGSIGTRGENRAKVVMADFPLLVE